ncbi:MAG: phosphodiester glycosidase family protein [Armatimonadetes bacterium]|nr:phosphodiester glycosidase family protein [Armatimonadota bacterium]
MEDDTVKMSSMTVPRWIPYALVCVLLAAIGNRVALHLLNQPEPEEPTPPEPSFSLRKQGESLLAPGLHLIEGEYHRDTFHLIVADLAGHPSLRLRTVACIGEGASVRKVALEEGALVALNGTFYDFVSSGPGQYRDFVPCGVVWTGAVHSQGHFYKKRRWCWAAYQQRTRVEFLTVPEVSRGTGAYGPPKTVERLRPMAGLGGVCGLIRDRTTVTPDERGHFSYAPGLDGGNARSAVGWTPSGRFLLITADHRWGWPDVQRFFLEAIPALLHEVTAGAVLLDGGSASHCWIYAPGRAPDRSVPRDHPLSVATDPDRHFGHCQVNRGGGFSMQNWRNATIILITDDRSATRRHKVRGDSLS